MCGSDYAGSVIFEEDYIKLVFFTWFHSPDTSTTRHCERALDHAYHSGSNRYTSPDMSQLIQEYGARPLVTRLGQECAVVADLMSEPEYSWFSTLSVIDCFIPAICSSECVGYIPEDGILDKLTVLFRRFQGRLVTKESHSRVDGLDNDEAGLFMCWYMSISVFKWVFSQGVRQWQILMQVQCYRGSLQ